jgi:ribonuclease-3
LRQALAHRSWVAERAGEASNERLEFLGDAVLGLAVADLVYKRYPDVAEGQLTDARKAVVNANALAELARELDIGPHILLGKGEAAAGGADKPSTDDPATE